MTTNEIKQPLVMKFLTFISNATIKEIVDIHILVPLFAWSIWLICPPGLCNESNVMLISSLGENNIPAIGAIGISIGIIYIVTFWMQRKARGFMAWILGIYWMFVAVGIYNSMLAYILTPIFLFLAFDSFWLFLRQSP